MIHSTPIHLYEQAMKLRRERCWGRRRMARKLGINESTVGAWIHEGRKPVIRGSFDSTPCPELSYLLGVRYSDGTVGKAFELEVIDRDYVEGFVRCLSKVMGKSYEIYKSADGHWFAFGCGKPILEFMHESLDQHKPIIEVYPADFLRGFFDGEGSVKRNWKNGRVYGKIEASNTNSKIIGCAAKLLRRHFSIHSTNWKENRRHLNWKDCYILAISRMGDIKQFYDLINFSISRKRRKLEKLLHEMESNPNWERAVAGTDRICPICGTRFQTRNPARKFCSIKCKNRACRK